MRNTLPLGRIAGLPVGVHWSVLAIVWLLTWNLAASLLPETAPGYPDTTYWLTGLATALVFFTSLLAHEAAHAVVARQEGIEVNGLTLWLLGGVASLGGQPQTPRADLRIAAAGPLTSFGLSVGFGVTAFLAGSLSVPDLLVAALAWLSAINLLLGVFNLIPGAPLDGGRVLRGLLWRRHGDWVRAATTASKAGQVVGYGFLWLGLLELALVGLGGLWLMLVGWFVLNASRDEYADIVAHHVLRDVRVGDVMSNPVRTAPGWISVQELVDRYLLEQPHSAYPVEDIDGGIVGLVTLRELRAVPADRRRTTLVADIARAPDEVTVATPQESLVGAIERQVDDSTAGGRILIFEGPDLVGIVTPTDVTRAVNVRTVHLAGQQPHSPQVPEAQR